jgi:hypothetical protein
MDVLGASSASLSCGKRGVLRDFFNEEELEETAFCVRASLAAKELEEGPFLTVPDGRASLDERPRVLMLGVFLEPPCVRVPLVFKFDEDAGTEVEVVVGLARRSSG